MEIDSVIKTKFPKQNLKITFETKFELKFKTKFKTNFETKFTTKFKIRRISRQDKQTNFKNLPL